ncbi:hypothetical protein CAL26_09165 [Bordetella genomosp. 9]|uniref:Uncharacterized protein n=1 Tax=Bordetella genomosp. 9 TaxID=1416803 RepID=A0A261RG42_9BORD|nr:hypothetical protein [Bordetella genomosp. 9]OZI23600.1 hypothetical protein CAL26_09165 [Bordetella genomosp. 9]
MGAHKLGLALLVAALVGASFVAGQVVGARDAKLFRAYDQKRESMMARSCGTHATLWRRASTGQYGCLSMNADGDSVIAPVFDAAVLSARR